MPRVIHGRMLGTAQPFEQAFLPSPDFSRRRAVLGSAPRPARAAEVYVSTEEGGEIAVIDPDRGEVVARIPVGKRPRGIKLSRDGKTLYVALSGSPRGGPGVDESKLPPADRSADGVGVVDLPTRKLVRTLPSGVESGVVRPVARRQNPLRLERGDRRDERARSRQRQGQRLRQSRRRAGRRDGSPRRQGRLRHQRARQPGHRRGHPQADRGRSESRPDPAHAPSSSPATARPASSPAKTVAS